MVDICSSYDFKISILETDLDHIHLLIESVPKLSPLTIIRTLKSLSTRKLWSRYPEILKKYYWKERTLWSDGYFVCSTGEASTEIIRKYIESQG